MLGILGGSRLPKRSRLFSTVMGPFGLAPRVTPLEELARFGLCHRRGGGFGEVERLDEPLGERSREPVAWFGAVLLLLRFLRCCSSIWLVHLRTEPRASSHGTRRGLPGPASAPPPTEARASSKAAAAAAPLIAPRDCTS